MWITKRWNRFPREAEQFPFMELFNTWSEFSVDPALSKKFNKTTSRGPSNLNYSTIVTEL